MSLDEFISCMGVVIYGKERFFRQDNGSWYDYMCGDFVSVEVVLQRIYEYCDNELSL